MKHYLVVICLVVLIVGAACWMQSCARHPRVKIGPPPRIGEACDPTLWEHTYHGSRFATAKDRLKPLKDCVTVTGTLQFVVHEKDGDAHMLLHLDNEYLDMPNAKNVKGTLVVESECEREPTQRDTIEEKVCEGFRQHLYSRDLNHKHVAVTGVYVEDEEHGWRELHPVSSINPQ